MLSSGARNKIAMIQERHGFLPLLAILSTGLAVLAGSLYLMIQLGMG